MPGLPDHLVQQVETRFMQEVDTRAALVMADMLDNRLPTNSQDRSAWTRFMLSLQLRTPADIAGIKTRVREDWGVTIPRVQATYESLKRLGDPATIEEFMTLDDPELVDRAAMKVATVLMDNPGIGKLINNMKWAVLDLRASNLELLTSDRGYEQIMGLGHPWAILTLPIAPRRLFIAAHDPQRIRNLANAKPRDIVRARNLTTVSLARTYVWASDFQQDAFIRSRFATVNAPTLGERLAQTGLAAAIDPAGERSFESLDQDRSDQERT